MDGTNGRGNRQTLAIEICGNYRRTGNNVGQPTYWYEDARANAEKLTGYLLYVNGWTDKDIYTHNDWIGKNCPRVILRQGYMPTFKKNAMAWKAKFAAAAGKPVAPKTNPIVGKSTTTVAQMQAWAKAKKANKQFVDLAPTFYNVAIKEGIDPAVVYTQSAKETGYMKFGGVLDASFKNPCGLKTTAGGADNAPSAHKKFKTWEEGIQAQVDHLALYAGAKGYPKADSPDPRHFPYLKGTAKTVEDLGGKWAPSKSYGTDIVKMMNDMKGYSTGSTPSTPSKKTNAQLAQEVLQGKWGNGADRKNRLTAAGYNYSAVQDEVNKLLNIKPSAPATKPKRKTNAELAREVIQGKWGNGADRKRRLEKEGYNYNAVQAEVEKQLGNKPSTPSKPKLKSNAEIAKEVIRGDWGNGADRKNRLTKAGYNYTAVQNEVDKQLKGSTSKPKLKSISVIAREVIAGDWGNGADRKRRLEAAGYNYDSVQKEVNKQLK